MEQDRVIRPRVRRAQRDTMRIQEEVNLKEHERPKKNSDGLEELFNNKNSKKTPINSEKERLLEEDTRNTPFEIPSNKWYRTFRKTNQMELANFVKNTTLSPDSLVRLAGSYSTKMIYNLKLRTKMVSGINTRASRVYYDREAIVSEAINNDFLSYISYSLNFINWMEKDTNKKIYQDNFVIMDGNLYWKIFLNKEETIEAEGIYLDKESIVAGNIKTLNEDKYLKIFIVENKDRSNAVKLLEDKQEEDYVLIVLDKKELNIELWIYHNDNHLPFSHGNLRRLKSKVSIQDNDKEYTKVKEKYEFERKRI